MSHISHVRKGWAVKVLFAVRHFRLFQVGVSSNMLVLVLWLSEEVAIFEDLPVGEKRN